MKAISHALFLLSFLFFIININAQTNVNRETVGILNIDAQGLPLDAEQLGNLTRIELAKMEIYNVIDRYDIEYLIKKNNINPSECYGKDCLIEAGRKIKADKMLTGSVEVLGEKILINFRLIDVVTGKTDRAQILEFLDLKNQVQAMIGLTLGKMFEQNIDQDLLKKLTVKHDYESSVNNPTVDQIELNGPRMGLTVFSGDVAQLYRAPEAVGGFDATPVMFQFGYQFEVKYLNAGEFQALFEFIPIVTGLDQGLFIPSVSILHGMRSNKTGWEFAFGPVVNIVKMADGYYDESGQWHLEDEWIAGSGPNPHLIRNRLDSRGEPGFNTSFLFAVGKTFKSGKLNIPINAFFIPGKSGHRFGLSVGFNTLARG